MKIKVGDTVMWRGSWGSEKPEPAVVTSLTVTETSRDKHGGVEVEEVDEELVIQNRVLFSLANGHWAYSDQISTI